MLSSKLRIMLWLYAGKEIIMENRKPSIEEIFKNGVTVDYELYKSEYVNTKREDIHDKYISILDKINEFFDINKDVPKEYLIIFLRRIADIKMSDFNITSTNQTFIERLIEAIILRKKNDMRSTVFEFALLVATNMYFKLIKLLNDYNIDISKPINIKVQDSQQNQTTTNINPQQSISNNTSDEFVCNLENSFVSGFKIDPTAFRNANNQIDLNKLLTFINSMMYERNYYMNEVLMMRNAYYNNMNVSIAPFQNQ